MEQRRRSAGRAAGRRNAGGQTQPYPGTVERPPAEDMASLVLNHAQGMRATTDRVDRLLRGLEADRERGGSVDRFGAGTVGHHRRPAG